MDNEQPHEDIRIKFTYEEEEFVFELPREHSFQYRNEIVHMIERRYPGVSLVAVTNAVRRTLPELQDFFDVEANKDAIRALFENPGSEIGKPYSTHEGLYFALRDRFAPENLRFLHELSGVYRRRLSHAIIRAGIKKPKLRIVPKKSDSFWSSARDELSSHYSLPELMYIRLEADNELRKGNPVLDYYLGILQDLELNIPEKFTDYDAAAILESALSEIINPSEKEA